VHSEFIPFILRHETGFVIRLEYNIKVYLREIGYEGVDWIKGFREHGNEPTGSMGGGEFLDANFESLLQ
jgi:hypothetical protein